MKQAIVIYIKDKPIMACEIKNFPDSIEFIKRKKECEQNMQDLVSVLKEKDRAISNLAAKVEKLEHEIKVLKGEE